MDSVVPKVIITSSAVYRSLVFKYVLAARPYGFIRLVHRRAGDVRAVAHMTIERVEQLYSPHCARFGMVEAATVY